MLVKLLCLCLSIIAVHGDNKTTTCPLKSETDLDLDKLSGMWYMDQVQTIPGENFTSIVKTMEFKKYGTNYTATTVNYKQANRNETYTVALLSGLYGNNETLMFRQDDPSLKIYMLAAEYDKFAILYVCNDDYDEVRRKELNETRFKNAAVLTRSQKVDGETRKKINNTLAVYPELYTFLNQLERLQSQ